tara:strand:- start:1038 stop:3152 length:2115 start_codon:yes stop_codon:yes gene_type:complete
MVERGLFICIILLCIPIVFANSLELDKQTYVTGETIVGVVNLDENVTAQPKATDIVLRKNGVAIDTVVFLLTKNPQQHYFYFDLPKTLAQDIYDVTTSLSYIDDTQQIQQITLNDTFNLIAVDPRFSQLALQQDPEGHFQNDLIITAYAALALQKVKPEVANLAVTWIQEKQDKTGCFPLNACTTIETGVGYKVLDAFGFDSSKAKNWLDGARNSVTEGTFTLHVSGGDGSCTIGNQEVTWAYQTEDFTQEIFNDVLIECAATAKANITYSYLGSTYQDLYQKSGTSMNITLDKQGCYGVGFKNNCDTESSAMVSWLINEKNDWLKDAFDDQDGLVAATLRKFDGDDYYTKWLESNKLSNGAYPSQANQEDEDALITSLAYIDDELTYTWLKQFSGTTLENAQVLYYVFNDQRPVSSVAVSPAVIVDGTDGIITFTNKESELVRVELTPPDFVTVDTTSFLLDDKKDVTVKINEKKDGTMTVTYGNSSTLVHFLALGEGAEVPTTSSIIISLVGNVKTTGLNLSAGKKSGGTLTIQNDGEQVNNLEVVIQGTIKEILKVEPLEFNLSVDGTKELTLTLNEDGTGKGEYDGIILIKDNKATYLEIPLSVAFSAETAEESVEEKENIFEDPEERTEVEVSEKKTEKKKSGSFWKWFLPLILILILGVVGFFFMKKKGKKENLSRSDEKILNIVNRYGRQQKQGTGQ